MRAAGRGRIGEDGFVWWYGVVEDRNDPEKLGRVQVRIYNWHQEVRTGGDKLKTEFLPWAEVLIPATSAGMSGIGISPSGLVDGSSVFGFFKDGVNAQIPMVIGTWCGRNEANPEGKGDWGFKDVRKQYQPHNDDVDKEKIPPDNTLKFYPKKIKKISFTDKEKGWGYKYTIAEQDNNLEIFSGDVPTSGEASPYPLESVSPGSEYSDNKVNDVNILARNDDSDKMKDTIVTFKRETVSADVDVAISNTDKLQSEFDNTASKTRQSDLSKSPVAKIMELEYSSDFEVHNPDDENGKKWASNIGTDIKWPQIDKTAELSDIQERAIDYNQSTNGDKEAQQKFVEHARHSKTWNEPRTAYGAVYPFNKVMETESGHIIEYDDTPGRERVHIWHRTGTFIEMHPDGTMVQRTAGSNFSIVSKDDHVHVQGGQKVTVDKGCKIKINDDVRDEDGEIVDPEDRTLLQQYGEDYEIEIGDGGDLNINVGMGHINLLVKDGNVNTIIEKGHCYTKLVDGDMKLDILKGDSKSKRGNMEMRIDGNFKQVVGGSYRLEVQGEILDIIGNSACKELNIHLNADDSKSIIDIRDSKNQSTSSPTKGIIKLNGTDIDNLFKRK